MTRDDIRKLIGGYATGSLTETERKLLFEAALDDQELFDELAHEQSLKELIEEPGARERLIAALDSRKPERAWWKQPWLWAAAAALSLGVVALVSTVSVIRHQPSKPAEIALAPPREQKPLDTPAPIRTVPTVKHPAKSFAAPTPPPVKEKAAEEDAKRRDETTENRNAKAEAPVVPPVAAPAAAPPAATPVAVRASPPELPPQQVATPSPRVQQQALDSGRMGLAKKATRFAFVYRIEPERYISITVAGDGYLRVETPTPPLMADNLHVPDGSTTRLKIPDGAQELTITFAATAPSAENLVSGRRAGAFGRLADRLTAKKDEASGSVEDPNPSVNSRLVVTVQLH